MSNLLALDQSSRVSGWAVFKDKKLIASGTFTKTNQDMGQRLYEIKQTVLSLISDYEIDEVILEDIQLQGNVLNNVQTFKILAEVFGVLYETLEELGIPNSAVLASVWKSALGIKGRNRQEQKKSAQQYVLETFNKKASQDECDAICIGLYKINDTKEQLNWGE